MSALPQEYAEAIEVIDEVEPISDEEVAALALADDPDALGLCITYGTLVAA